LSCTETHIIQILWEGPYKLSELNKLTNVETDYGLYQIYGYHPLYGSNVLLYIGKADQQTFGMRIRQEKWDEVNDSNNDQIYIGRLHGAATPSEEQWSNEISLAEQLLIYVHKTGFNSSSISSYPELVLQSVHVLNWGDHRDLYPEVSGYRFTEKLDDTVFEQYKIE
jgi:hypothetical protein